IGCYREAIFTNNETEEVNLFLTVTTPSPLLPTRNQTDEETAIKEIVVAVFNKDGEYEYYTDGFSINSNGANTSFNARLKASETPVKIFLIANATSQFLQNEPSVGDSENEVKKKIMMDYNPSITSDFPMFGGESLQKLETGTTNTLNGIKMLRSIARVDVKTSLNTGEFELLEIKAYRINDKIQIIPDNIDENQGTVINPSVPSTSQANINSSLMNVNGEQYSSAQLYISEAENYADANEQTKKATCIVVGGKYKGSSEITYYRMDFGTNINSIGKILRNYRYVFNITDVYEEGWSNPDDAANNRTSYIEADILEWNEDDSYITFDASNYFSISSRTLEIGHYVNSQGTFEVDTDVENYTIQLIDESGNPYSNSIGKGETMITPDGRFEFHIASDGYTIQVKALQENLSGEIITQYLQVNANRLRVKLTVHQNWTKVINVFSYSVALANLGDMGGGIFNSGTSIAEARGRCLRGILEKTNLYGLGGIVDFGGYHISGTSGSTSSTSTDYTPSQLEFYDVIYLNHLPKARINNIEAEYIINWLEANENRVLVVHYDHTDYNSVIMNAIGTPYSGSLTTNAYTVYEGAPDIIMNGPFGTVDPTFRFRVYDTTHGQISLDYALENEISPVLLDGNNGNVALGIDFNRRIVYCGDIDYYYGLDANMSGVNAGAQRMTSNGFSNIENANDADKLIANVWAWIAETVLAN
ncbi:MAG: hypothetical protein LIO65_07980, partial [Odoribacter sp.]|nr:hypothetical protein [Odoribacter sp.]